MEIVVRATVVFWVLWVLLRAAGKRELAEMTPFELIVLVVLGDLIQQGVTSEDMSITGAVLAISTIMLWTLLLSYATYRSRRLAGMLESRPALLVVDGRYQHEMLAAHRLTPDDVISEARQEGIADVRQIRYAVIEDDGKFSFILKDAPDP